MLLHLHELHAAVSKTRLALEEKKCGWTWKPMLLLLEDKLDIGIETVMMYDWFHIYLANGIFSTEAVLLLATLK